MELPISAKLKRTEASIEEYRAQIDTRKAENYGFASMAAIAYAHIVAKILSRKHPKGTSIVLAPNPKDIVCIVFSLTFSSLTQCGAFRFGQTWIKQMLNLPGRS